MSKVVMLSSLIICLGMAGVAVAQCPPESIGTDQFKLEFGNSWGHNTSNPPLGSPLTMVGRLTRNLPSAGGPMKYDMASTSEYTVYITGVDLDAFYNASEPDTFIYGGGGTITVYYDTSKDAPRPPTANPPNANVPALFTDGSPILFGTIDDLLINFRNAPGAFPDSTGEVRGRVTFTGGDSLGILIAPIWVWNATVSSNFAGNVPGGYNWFWGGELKNDCIPIGACCFCDSTCQDGLTEAECTAAGGTYAGNGTQCATTICPLVGACCYPDGSCAEDVYQVDCVAAGGVFYACKKCDEVTCIPVGACCFCDGTCQDGLTQTACIAAGGTYVGNGTLCATTTCPLIGACCYPDGSCADGVNQVDCVAAGGLFYPCLKCDQVICVNAVEPKSWGGLKGIYR